MVREINDFLGDVYKMAQMKSAVEDLKDERVPPSLYWTVDQVADWIEELGFPYYRVKLEPCQFVPIIGF